MSATINLQAAEFTGTLWAAIYYAGGPRRPATRGHQHFKVAYDPKWLATLSLPLDNERPPSLPVALLDEDHDEFDRHIDSRALTEAYANRPRTRVYEDICRDDPHAWYARTAHHLGCLAACELQVVCSIFQSKAGDESLDAHWDAWYGAIVQMSGAKKWKVGPSLLESSPYRASEITTRAGDILLIPKGLPHVAATAEDLGHSVHLAFAIDRDGRPSTRV